MNSYAIGPFFFGSDRKGFYFSYCPDNTNLWLSKRSCYVRINGTARYLWGAA